MPREVSPCNSWDHSDVPLQKHALFLKSSSFVRERGTKAKATAYAFPRPLRTPRTTGKVDVPAKRARIDLELGKWPPRGGRADLWEANADQIFREGSDQQGRLLRMGGQLVPLFGLGWQKRDGMGRKQSSRSAQVYA